MCKSKMAINASEPSAQSPHASRAAESSNAPPTPRSSSREEAMALKSLYLPPISSNPSTSSNNNTGGTGDRLIYSSTISFRDSSRTSLSSFTSLSSLRDSLPETPTVYNFSEICAATNNFLAKKHSSGVAVSWRCTLRGKHAIVFQRKLRRKMEKSQLKEKLSEIYRSHHVSIIKLLGASIAGDNHIYLVYEFVDGANLAVCLRNPRSPNFTVLSTWISRMQIAADLAHGLDYIHNNTGLNDTNLLHNHIKSSSIIITETSHNARICHFGTAQLCGETEELSTVQQSKGKNIEILNRSNSRTTRLEGVRGYMSPEYQLTGIASQKSDVYSVGVVILELLTGEEPLKYKYDKESGDFKRTSVIETAAEVINGDWKLRSWIDRRLKDSFPVEVAERVTRVALECVNVDPDKRPNMRRVAGKMSKLFLESERWSRKFKMPTEISVSLAPR